VPHPTRDGPKRNMREDSDGLLRAEAFQVGLQPLLTVCGDLRQLEKRGEGSAVVSDNSLIERVAAGAEDSDLTLDAGVCLQVYCTLRMQKPLLWLQTFG
jgi:hypothetical protein